MKWVAVGKAQRAPVRGHSEDRGTLRFAHGHPSTGSKPKSGRDPGSVPRSGRVLLLGDQPRDLVDRVEVLDPGLVRLDGHAEALLEEDDELERADRVEDAAGDQGGVVGELVRVLARE